MRSLKYLLTGGAIMAAIGMAAAQPATTGIPYRRMVDQMKRFTDIPPDIRKDVIVRLHLVHKDAHNHAPFHVWAMVDHRRVDIPVGQDDEFELPDHPDWVAKNVMIEADQPEGSVTLEPDILLAIPAGNHVELSYLREAMTHVYETMRYGARQMGGYMMQMLVPVPHSVKITLPGCCQGTATVHRGPDTVVLPQGQDGIITISRQILKKPGDGTIILSDHPVKLDIDSGS